MCVKLLAPPHSGLLCGLTRASTLGKLRGAVVRRVRTPSSARGSEQRKRMNPTGTGRTGRELLSVAEPSDTVALFCSRVSFAAV